MESKTIEEYKEVIDQCKAIFEKKTKDYGTAWRILRLPSITDQIFIKAQRIRSIQDKGNQRISEDIGVEFIGIINYCIIALIQLQLKDDSPLEIPSEELMTLYDKAVEQTINKIGTKFMLIHVPKWCVL